MFGSRALVLWILITSSCRALYLTFPPEFKFGAASSSYQIEGAWNASDKSTSVWDKMVHDSPEAISDRSTADVACDSYHLWQRDIEIAEELGLHFYRFSISWPRLLPNGFSNYISKDGQEYYDSLINGLLLKGIEPLVTIHHWDVPQNLQDLGTFDFFAINHYTSRLIRHAKPGEELQPWPIGDVPDLNGKLLPRPDWPGTTSSWFFVYPEGLRRQLVWLKKQYGDIEFLITENGYASGPGLNDTARANYIKDYLEQVLLAINEDGVNVTGYTAWALMDNFEWMDGYQSKFGLYQVDFESPMRTRTPRFSAAYYKNIIKTHRLVDPNNEL
ncbi:hypothetical protein K1T71_012876 [Dendrolimus kikuchii]|uniref:Uncharacterized protein n=1 Tax=Dendrolimus kikuchii TaxID=765133 RepID=A0ACC1CIC1_9NEOP|nr:hypothetical protein K1T71_012876 [Dendrolimus kikuchii]